LYLMVDSNFFTICHREQGIRGYIQ
jgi:hypothetical protein